MTRFHPSEKKSPRPYHYMNEPSFKERQRAGDHAPASKMKFRAYFRPAINRVPLFISYITSGSRYENEGCFHFSTPSHTYQSGSSGPQPPSFLAHSSVKLLSLRARSRREVERGYRVHSKGQKNLRCVL